MPKMRAHFSRNDIYCQRSSRFPRTFWQRGDRIHQSLLQARRQRLQFRRLCGRQFAIPAQVARPQFRRTGHRQRQQRIRGMGAADSRRSCTHLMPGHKGPHFIAHRIHRSRCTIARDRINVGLEGLKQCRSGNRRRTKTRQHLVQSAIEVLERNQQVLAMIETEHADTHAMLDSNRVIKLSLHPNKGDGIPLNRRKANDAYRAGQPGVCRCRLFDDSPARAWFQAR